MSLPIKICLYFAVYQRLEVLEVFLKGVERLQYYHPHLEIEPFAVCSDEQESAVLSNHGVSHIIYPNQPLGAKKNAGLRAALKSDWDYLMEIGSDDLLSNSLLDLYYPMFAKGDLAWGVNSCYFYETTTGRVGRHNNHYPIGAGRCFARKVFDMQKMTVKVMYLRSHSGERSFHGGSVYEVPKKMAEQLVKHGIAIEMQEPEKELEFWTPTRQRALDGDSMTRLKWNGIDINCIYTDKPYVLDIKSGQNINSIDLFEIIDYPILDHFPEGDDVRRLR